MSENKDSNGNIQQARMENRGEMITKLMNEKNELEEKLEESELTKKEIAKREGTIFFLEMNSFLTKDLGTSTYFSQKYDKMLNRKATFINYAFKNLLSLSSALSIAHMLRKANGHQFNKEDVARKIHNKIVQVSMNFDFPQFCAEIITFVITLNLII